MMVREIRNYGLRRGVRAWFTWASVDDITTLTRTTRARRAVWRHLPAWFHSWTWHGQTPV